MAYAAVPDEAGFQLGGQENLAPSHNRTPCIGNVGYFACASEWKAVSENEIRFAPFASFVVVGISSNPRTVSVIFPRMQQDAKTGALRFGADRLLETSPSDMRMCRCVEPYQNLYERMVEYQYMCCRCGAEAYNIPHYAASFREAPPGTLYRVCRLRYPLPNKNNTNVVLAYPPDLSDSKELPLGADIRATLAKGCSLDI